MSSRNGFKEQMYTKDPSLYQLTEVDITKLPKSILAGLLPASGEEAVLRSEELYPENTHEVWIVQCPTNVQLAPLLQSKKLYLDDRPQLFSSDVTGDKTFEAICLPIQESDRQGEVALLPDDSGKMELVSFPISGHIVIKELVDELSRTVPTPTPKKVHQLPSGVKVRHPIYGTDYENIIQDLPLQLPPRKKRKHAEHINETPPPNKKKREAKVLETFAEPEPGTPPRKKRKKAQNYM